MPVDVTQAVTTPATAGLMGLAGSSAGATKAAEDHDMFLQLLVAQLKYQDPMNPADSTQFMSQNAQFTALEKMQDVADGMDQLLSAQLSFGAANMIGRKVSWIDEAGATQSGIADGVSFGATGPVLSVAGASVPVVSVTAVADPGTTA